MTSRRHPRSAAPIVPLRSEVNSEVHSEAPTSAADSESVILVPQTDEARATPKTFTVTHDREAFRQMVDETIALHRGQDAPHSRADRPKHGSIVREFEREFAQYVGADYAIALVNGTATLHTALLSLGITRGEIVAVPPLTMAATTIAVLHAGGVPLFVDVDDADWLMMGTRDLLAIPVSLYGAHYPGHRIVGRWIDDAAQTLRPHDPRAQFTSYSFQASKILALGEGGMLVTNDPTLAEQARMFSSLGYLMRADQSRIDPAAIKASDTERHHALGWNYRMNDLTAAEGLRQLATADASLRDRRQAAAYYRDAIDGCDWLRVQTGLGTDTHDAWAVAVALASHAPITPTAFAGAIAEHGGEVPYGAWRLAYTEPAFRRYASVGYDSPCPNAERLQPRILQFQTNELASAEQNADALAAAIRATSRGGA